MVEVNAEVVRSVVLAGLLGMLDDLPLLAQRTRSTFIYHLRAT